MAAAQDQAGRRDHAVGPLWPPQARILFDTVDRHFRAAPEHRKHSAVLAEVDSVVAPLTGCDLAAIEAENSVKLPSVESYRIDGGEGRGYARGFAATRLARVGFAGTGGHAAPPLLTLLGRS